VSNTDPESDRQTDKPRWTRSSILAFGAVFAVFAVLMATCGTEPSLPQQENQPEPQQQAFSHLHAELLAGTVWSCGAYLSGNPNLVVININELSDEDALYMAEDLAHDLEEDLIPQQDFAAGVRVLQLILSSRD